MEAATAVIVIQAQAESFPEEVSRLKSKKPVPKSSRLHSLSPVLGEDGITRMDGRLQRSPDLRDQVKLPILLDPKHYVTQLLIQDCHVRMNHQGQESVLNELRQEYWILHGRAAVKAGARKCPVCRLEKAKPQLQEMGLLPRSRVTRQSRAFVETGLDYFGSMEVTVGRRHEKRYGALFTCMATRAVHIELAPSLTTDSAIMAIRRFMSIRGCPKTIYSDNGTNFRGADTELKKAFAELDHNQIERRLSKEKTEWKFIPPSGPHMGGAWERMVQSVKKALKAILKGQYPREEVLLTLLAEAAHSVNSRPLTHVSLDPNDPEALTPNHFLIGSSSNMMTPGFFSKADLDLRSQWRRAQALSDQFWTRWVKEYLPTLNQRSKWLEKGTPLKIGDLIFIGDGDSPRNTWPKGIITAVYPGPDGQVRVVDVRTSHRTLRRPIMKIMVPGSEVLGVEPQTPTPRGGMSPSIAIPSQDDAEDLTGTQDNPEPVPSCRSEIPTSGYHGMSLRTRARGRKEEGRHD